MKDKQNKTVISPKIQANRGARLAAVQALFQVELTGKAGKKVLQEFVQYRLSDDDTSPEKTFANLKLFKTLVKAAIEDHIMIDAQVSARLASGWTFLDVPIAVIIDEYVGIVAAFHDGPEAGFVNGILDKLAKETKADVARGA
ncbi:MAG: N utilization substance protein B [Hyphomonadaceae bacterium]|nr:MAG: N utilization substance protein B [Hyphomonadaceae bacterium]